VEQSAAEQVGPVNLGLWILGSEGRFDSGIRRPQPECPVRAVGVVVLEVDLQHLLKVAAADAQQPVQAFGTDRADPSVRRRRWRWVPAPAGRASSALRPEHVVEGAGELGVAVAQHKRSGCFRSPSTTSRLRACWVTQALLGLAVTPARWTRRVSSSMKNRTYSRRNQIVSTVKKSQATIPAACWRRNARQVVAIGRGAGSNP